MQSAASGRRSHAGETSHATKSRDRVGPGSYMRTARNARADLGRSCRAASARLGLELGLAERSGPTLARNTRDEMLKKKGPALRAGPKFRELPLVAESSA